MGGLKNRPEINFSDISGKDIKLNPEQLVVLKKQQEHILKNTFENHNTLAIAIKINKNPENLKTVQNLFNQHLV